MKKSKAVVSTAEIAELHLPDSPVATILDGCIVEPILTKNLNIQLTLKRWEQLERSAQSIGADLRSEIEFIVMNTPMVEESLRNIEEGRHRRELKALQSKRAAA